MFPIIRRNKLEGFITEAKTNPSEYIEKTIERTTEVEIIVNSEFEDWFAQDQMSWGWLYNSIEINVAAELMDYTTSKQL